MDANDYDQAVTAHRDALCRYAGRQLRDREKARDIVQDCYLRLWVHRHRVEAAKVRPFLFITAHNLIVDRSRRHKYVTRYDDGHENILITHQPKAGVAEVIDRALDTLTPTQRSLVLLRDLEGYSYQDIAAITGLGLTKVKVYLFRARRAMRAYIGEPALVA
ncbi:MAG: RNA polymerase sigma factor [Bacteroidetes bacterium]|nr:RNA polymerase sigma factor [Bacteroidota bacterium]